MSLYEEKLAGMEVYPTIDPETVTWLGGSTF